MLTCFIRPWKTSLAARRTAPLWEMLRMGLAAPSPTQLLSAVHLPMVAGASGSGCGWTGVPSPLRTLTVSGRVHVAPTWTVTGSFGLVREHVAPT